MCADRNHEIVSFDKTVDSQIQYKVLKLNEEISFKNSIDKNKGLKAQYTAPNADTSSNNAIEATSKPIKETQKREFNKQQEKCEEENQKPQQKQEPNTKKKSTNGSKKAQQTSKTVGQENSNLSSNYSTISLCSVKPRIMLGPGETQSDTNPWALKSKFDDLAVNIVYLKKGHDRNEYRKLLETIAKMRSISQTSYMEGQNYTNDQHASYQEEAHGVFANSRIATLRKSPTRIVLQKSQTESQTIFSTSESMLDQNIYTVRIDEAQVRFPRFDPYHSDCGPDCRKCLFLMQTLPHLYPKIMRMKKLSDTIKPSKKKITHGDS